jgi:hypothetical protein
MKGSNRVNRGGSWNNTARNCRSANRNNNTPDNRNNNLGFRLVLNSAGVRKIRVPGRNRSAPCLVGRMLNQQISKTTA